MSMSALSILVSASLTLGPLMRRIYSGSNTAFIGRMAESGSFNCSSCVRSSTLALTGCLVGRVFVNIPAAEDQIVKSGERDEILDHRGAIIGALAQPDGGKLGQRADGLAAGLA